MRTIQKVKAPVACLTFESDREESRAILEQIQEHLKAGGKYEDIAILVRSRMAVQGINLALKHEKLPVNDTTKFADFMSSDVMVDALNFIKVFTNPKDVYAFMGIIDRPKRGIGATAIEKLEQTANTHQLGIVEYLLSEHISELTPGLRKKVQDVVDVYAKLIRADNHQTLSEMLSFLLERTGYMNWLNGFEAKKKNRELENVELLHAFVKDFETQYTLDHEDFTLYDVARDFVFDCQSMQNNVDKDGITIATIHGAKGLEWPLVFLVGMEEQIFPGTKLVDITDMESERRLMYVAITRAKDKFVATSAMKRLTMGGKELDPSVFLDEFSLVESDDSSEKATGLPQNTGQLI